MQIKIMLKFAAVFFLTNFDAFAQTKNNEKTIY